MATHLVAEKSKDEGIHIRATAVSAACMVDWGAPDRRAETQP
jgi:hypothetical protein